MAGTIARGGNDSSESTSATTLFREGVPPNRERHACHGKRDRST